MSLDRFFELFPRFKKYHGNPTIQDMYNYTSTPENIDKMLTANDLFEMPALAGIIKELQAEFHNPAKLNFIDNEVRQLIGGMVKEVILDFGYEVKIQKSLKGSEIIRSATHYKKNPANATKVLKKVPIVETIERSNHTN